MKKFWRHRLTRGLLPLSAGHDSGMGHDTLWAQTTKYGRGLDPRKELVALTSDFDT